MSNTESGITHINAGRVTLRKVLESSRSLKVPPYQRSFSWTKSEVDELWDDLKGILSGDDGHYFLGAMVLIERKNVCEVVDGQQRLATLSLFFAAIRNILKARGEDDRAGIVDKEALCRKNIKTLDVSPILSLNVTDDDMFRQIIGGDLNRHDLYRLSRDKSRSESQRLLASAYVNYHDRLGKIVAANGIECLTGYHESLLDRVVVIEITTTDDDSAYTLFETLNDRGLDLIDLCIIAGTRLSR